MTGTKAGRWVSAGHPTFVNTDNDILAIATHDDLGKLYERARPKKGPLVELLKEFTTPVVTTMEDGEKIHVSSRDDHVSIRISPKVPLSSMQLDRVTFYLNLIKTLPLPPENRR
ncbi:hypothetical protein NLI96_g9195 [Meripilus lineatus]|uniref:Uncharacterized protein n=1 Tax=Meripilus lineatus TaxID=2056292 RepID=A0AAD5UVX6_9APHY|nr:hypothetical protein NLI96_g9195 [Physisporinus lineatus]